MCNVPRVCCPHTGIPVENVDATKVDEVTGQVHERASVETGLGIARDKVEVAYRAVEARLGTLEGVCPTFALCMHFLP